jgi:pyruvate/2-oxoglutarate dehydrogenase complex dihydrolipoamide dehydrogenase (E3) component
VKELDHRLDVEVVFTDPQVAVLGLNETRAKIEKIPSSHDSYPFADHGKASVLAHRRVCEIARGSSDW